jgi:hypothetical protein
MKSPKRVARERKHLKDVSPAKRAVELKAELKQRVAKAGGGAGSASARPERIVRKP